MTHNYMTGAELQALREACGLDRDQFGALCGVRGRSIKYWETGASNHGVPADVAALVQELEAKVSSMAADAISRYSGASDVVIVTSSIGGSVAAGFAAFLVPAFALFHALSSNTDARAAVIDGVSSEHRKCPYCAEAVRKEAIKFKHCGSELSSL